MPMPEASMEKNRPTTTKDGDVRSPQDVDAVLAIAMPKPPHEPAQFALWFRVGGLHAPHSFAPLLPR